jgi:hypothetical protein
MRQDTHIQTYTTQDENTVTIAAPVLCGISFTFRGVSCRIVPEIVTYRIRRLSYVSDNVYRCEMVGTNGHKLTFHVSDKDVMHNLSMTAGVFDPPVASEYAS